MQSYQALHGRHFACTCGRTLLVKVRVAPGRVAMITQHHMSVLDNVSCLVAVQDKGHTSNSWKVCTQSSINGEYSNDRRDVACQSWLRIVAEFHWTAEELSCTLLQKSRNKQPSCQKSRPVLVSVGESPLTHSLPKRRGAPAVSYRPQFSADISYPFQIRRCCPNHPKSLPISCALPIPSSSVGSFPHLYLSESGTPSRLGHVPKLGLSALGYARAPRLRLPHKSWPPIRANKRTLRGLF